MRNESEIDIKIHCVNADFVGVKGKDGFEKVIEDFKNAKEVRILTYSRISNKKLNILKNIPASVELHIIVALPGLIPYSNNCYYKEDILKELDKIKSIFDISKDNNKTVKISVCLKNHAKLVGTDNILYVGSANYSDYSCRNYEAGILISDKNTIQRIYKEFFDNIVAVRYNEDIFYDFRIKLLSITNNLEDLFIGIEEFISFFEAREEKAEYVKKKYSELCVQIQAVSEISNDFKEKYNMDILDEIEDLESLLNSIEKQISGMFDSNYEKDMAYFAYHYEREHMSRMGVHAKDQCLESGFPYITLAEEPYMDTYISEYWLELEDNEEVIETIGIIDDAIGITKRLINLMNEQVDKDNCEAFKQLQSELVRVGTNDKCLK